MELKDLTTEFLTKFKKGKMEIQYQGYFGRFLYRGGVADVWVNEEGGRDTIRVKLDWWAKMDDGRWVHSRKTDYSLHLWFNEGHPRCSIQEVGESRLVIQVINSPYNKFITFSSPFPPPKKR